MRIIKYLLLLNTVYTFKMWFLLNLKLVVLWKLNSQAMRCIISKLKPAGMEISSQSSSTTDNMLKKLRARQAREAMMKKIRKDANSFTR